MLIEILKVCTKCNEEKDLSEFNKGNAKFGRKSECKKCQAKRGQEYKKIPEVREKYRADCRERYRRQSIEQRRGTYQRRKQYVKDWVEANRDRHKKTKHEYYLKNKSRYYDKAKYHNHTRRALLSKGPKLTRDVVVELEIYNLSNFKQNSFTCEYCLAIIESSYHLDHIVPVVLGGNNHITNLAITCPKCNRSKGARLLEDTKILNYLDKRNNEFIKNRGGKYN